VLKEELTPQNVIVQPEPISMLLYNIVPIVHINVKLVPLPKLVSHVLTGPELKNQFVNVKMDTMITVKPNVQLVKNNVTSVSINQTTVLFVLEKESIHQSVYHHHQRLNPPLLKMSQLVLLKLLNVPINVLLVKSPLITVLLVKNTESMPHIVIVPPDTMNTNKSVMLVLTDVLNVLLT